MLIPEFKAYIPHVIGIKQSPPQPFKYWWCINKEFKLCSTLCLLLSCINMIADIYTFPQSFFGYASVTFNRGPRTIFITRTISCP